MSNNPQQPLTATTPTSLQPTSNDSTAIVLSAEYRNLPVEVLSPGDRSVIAPMLSGKPTLSMLARQSEQSRALTRRAVADIVANLDKALNTARPLTAAVLDVIADDVIDTYGRMIRIADLVAVARNARRGDYGTTFYGGLSAPAVLDMIERYLSHRCTLLERLHDEEDARRNTPLPPPPVSAQLRPLADLMPPQPTTAPPPPAPPTYLSATEIAEKAAEQRAALEKIINFFENNESD